MKKLAAVQIFAILVISVVFIFVPHNTIHASVNSGATCQAGACGIDNNCLQHCLVLAGPYQKTAITIVVGAVIALLATSFVQFTKSDNFSSWIKKEDKILLWPTNLVGSTILIE
ncbi:hypothetical protein ACFL04_00985 [Patescibacteria group bacterium]